MEYQLLRGRRGASGHVRRAREEQTVSLRGLPPETECALFEMEGKSPLARLRTDKTGAAQASLASSGPVFAAAEDQVLVWEGEEDGYFRACACLKGWRPGRETTSPATPAPADVPSSAPPKAEKPASVARSDPEPEEAWRLRPPGAGAPVDALPTVIWPPEAEKLRKYFEQYPPFAPFNAPGWRFVRMASPVKEAIYCAVGRHIRDGRVDEIAYALPGTPYHAPGGLSGYTYQPGEAGQGYWVLRRKCEG